MCDFATAVLAVMADVWCAMAGVRADDAEKGSEEERGGVDAVYQLDKAFFL
jgi:hypothetical protein